MKKLYLLIALLAVFIAPYWLPVPLISSGWHSQYGFGDTITIDLAAWNTTPLNRTITGEQPSDITLTVDGVELAVTPTADSAHIPRFSRVAQTVNYTIDKEPGQSNRLDAMTGALQLTPGAHDISIRWLGSSSWSRHITIVEL